MTEIVGMMTYSEYLEHAGVKGMKWGKRKDKEVSKEKQAKRETKALKFDAKSDVYGLKVKDLNAQLKALPPGFKGYLKRPGLVDDRNLYLKLQEKSKKDAKAVREGKLTSTQKKLIIGGIVVGTVLAVTAVSFKASSGELNALKLKGQQILQGKESIFNKKDLYSSKNYSPDQVLNTVVKGVNPNYNTPGGHLNCRRATFAFELRRRGYDVTATTSQIGAGQNESGLLNALSKGDRNRNTYASIMQMVQSGRGLQGTPRPDSRTVAATRKVLKEVDSSTILDALKGQPNGARGEILMNFGKFGHSMAYEVFDGKPVIFDPQKAAKYVVDPEGMGNLVGKWGYISDAVITRLDDVPLDLDFLARWATNA